MVDTIRHYVSINRRTIVRNFCHCRCRWKSMRCCAAQKMFPSDVVPISNHHQDPAVVVDINQRQSRDPN